MHWNRIVILVLSLCVLLSVGAAPATASHDNENSILDLIQDIVEDGGFEELEDPYILFSGDRQPDSLPENYNQEQYGAYFDEKENVDIFTFYRAEDYGFKYYNTDVDKWNALSIWEFEDGGEGTSIAPGNLVKKDDLVNPHPGGSGNVIKEYLQSSSRPEIGDGYIKFYSVESSVYTHYSPDECTQIEQTGSTGTRCSTSGSQQDETTRKVSPTTTINTVSSARILIPEDVVDYEEDEKIDYSVEDYDVEWTRLYLEDCPQGGECLLGESSGQWRNSFRNINFQEEGEKTLRVESRITGSAEREFYDYDRCSENETDCGWQFEYEDVVRADPVVVSDTITLNVSRPDATATRAQFPTGRTEYQIEGLEQGEWSHITFEDDEQNSVIGLRSNWAYFGSEDERWLLTCERDGGNPLLRSGPCSASLGDSNHINTTAIPVRQHAFPENSSVVPLNKTQVVQVTDKSSATFPLLHSHKTCRWKEAGKLTSDSECAWNFPEYKQPNLNRTETPTYDIPHSLVIQRPVDEEDITIWGITRENPREVPVQETIEVKGAVLEVTDVEDTNPENGMRDIEVSLTTESGTPISLQDRPNSEIQLSKEGEVIERYKTDSSGTFQVELNEDENYQFAFKPTPWYELPDSKQPYVATTVSYSVDQTPPIGYFVGLLFEVGVLIGFPTVVLHYVGRLFGVNLLGKIWKPAQNKK